MEGIWGLPAKYSMWVLILHLFLPLAEEAASRPLARSGSPGGRLPFIQCYIDDLIAISMKLNAKKTGRTCQKWKKSFLDQLDTEIQKFLQIPNKLAKTFNLTYHMPKVKKNHVFSGFPDPVFPVFRINRIRKSGNSCRFRTGLPRRSIWYTICKKWFLGPQMVQTLLMGLAPASGVRARSGHHH